MTGFNIDAATWATLDRLLDEALDQAEHEREPWIDGLPVEYEALKPRLRSLLARGARSSSGGRLGTLPKLLGDDGPGNDEEGAVGSELSPPSESAEVDLAPGARLGRFEIRGLLGAGGMGRVYRAFDPDLGREVAVKGLARALRSDPGNLLRVEREARLLATLSHPNIAGIHGFERIDGSPFLILELVEGETLAERLERGPLALTDAVGAALQVASALEEAHGKGVVHRDLKPSNLKLDGDGRVKVLDFGIAKATSGSLALVLEGVPPTASGLLRGTAPYMSPEQLRGEPADRRGDNWAFGCVLFEMLTGHRPFPGTTAAEVTAAILRDDVDWRLLAADTPHPLRRLLRRCLTREKRDRLQDIGDARVELQDLTRGEVEASTSTVTRPRASVPLLRGVALLAAAGAGAGLAMALRRPPDRPQPEPPTAVRLNLELPRGLALEDDYAAPFALSPDGSRLVVLAKAEGPARLYVRDLGRAEARPLEGTEGAWQPFFSPDGREVAFFADRKLKKVALTGGPAVTLAEIGDNPRGGSWGPDGAIVLAGSYNTGLSRVSANGGVLAPLTTLDLPKGESAHRWPQVLPGGQWVLFTVGFDSASFDDAAIDAVLVATGERRRLALGGSYARYAPGRLLFAQAGRLLGIPMELETLALHGGPEPVLDDVRYDPRNGSTHLAFSETGTLVYGTGLPTSLEHHLTWVDGEGRLTRIEGMARRFREPRISPDGRRIAVVVGGASSSDLWVVDTLSSTLSRASFDLSPHRPAWRPDGQSITVGTQVGGRFRLVTLPASGTGEVKVLLESENRVFPDDWSPDGRFLVFQERRARTGWDLRLLETTSAGEPGSIRDLAARPFQEANASVSPDGRLLAYESDELDGISETYVLPLADPSAYVRATSTGSNWPRWDAEGNLFCWLPPRVHAAPHGVADGLHRTRWTLVGGRPTPGATSQVWPAAARGPAFFDRLLVAAFAGYDIDLSRRPPRFLMLETKPAPNAPTPGKPVVVLNWFEELRAQDQARRPQRP